jgi:hypothetical protein
MNLRDVAVTISGFATPGVLAIAFATFWRQRREDQLASARLVIATLDRQASNEQPAVKVTNHSKGPISQVWVGVPGDMLPEHHVSVIPPGESASISVIPESDRWAVQNIGCGGPMTPTEPRVRLRFVDARNQAWRREGYDKPTRSRTAPDRPNFG